MKAYSWQRIWLTGLLILSIGSFFILPSAELCQNLTHCFSASSFTHPLGTDGLGRDLLLRLLAGTRISLLVGLCATTVSVCIATIYGILSGYIGGRTDYWLMRILDVLYALPLTLLVLLFMVFFGNGLLSLVLAISLTEWFTLARVIRTKTLTLRHQTFLLSALAIGQSHWKILFRHLLPNLRATILSYAFLILPSCILMEAFLSFLGLGVPPPASSWGNMIYDGAHWINAHPAQLIYPSLFLVLTLVALTSQSHNA